MSLFIYLCLVCQVIFTPCHNSRCLIVFIIAERYLLDHVQGDVNPGNACLQEHQYLVYFFADDGGRQSLASRFATLHRLIQGLSMDYAGLKIFIAVIVVGDV